MSDRSQRTATATAIANANIALIKYWGNRDNALRLPSNGSISMNLDGLYTRTTVSFQPSLPFDELIISGHEVTGKGLDRCPQAMAKCRQVEPAFVGVAAGHEVACHLHGDRAA